MDDAGKVLQTLTRFDPHSPTPGMMIDTVNGLASVNVGCMHCHGSKVALEGTDGSLITVDHLQPDADGKATNSAAVAFVKRDAHGRPVLHSSSWPNTGIGRLNLDGSLGSCSACHSRHDFSPRRARQPEPGEKIMAALTANELISKAQFDDEIEWTWFYLWHHEGRRARHGASMMAPDYAPWHGMYEVAERFYQELIPQAREIAEQATAAGKGEAAAVVLTVIDEILARPEHQWYEKNKIVFPQEHAAIHAAPADPTTARPSDAPATTTTD